MDVIDYNGDGLWSRVAIFERYARYAAELDVPPRNLSPQEHEEGNRHWVYPVMDKIIDGIEAGDRACIRLGIEFIEEDRKFAFGKILKSNTARALRRAPLTEAEQGRIRKRVFDMLRAGLVPHEFNEYAKLVKKMGFSATELGEVPGTSERVSHFRSYFQAALQAAASDTRSS